MFGPAIPVAVLSGFVLWGSSRIHRRGGALRTRGIRTSATCVNTGAGSGGSVHLMIQFTTDSGEGIRTTVGPFDFPPARVGGALDVVYDPQDPVNVTTPDRVGSGKVALSFVTGSATTLLLSFGLLVLG
ncbi:MULTISPECIES: DUF3592 domain-containing protein [unclassified Streptomyces]|uniref:DUF3592 domain-containing protein n=2 Tax=Kitasatosporales TaxID=85011 RepID=UPI002D2190B1|nr:DUF3592 domain-containing protein [Streptomyces sp. BoleA5]